MPLLDSACLDYFADPSTFADTINGSLFGGLPVVDWKSLVPDDSRLAGLAKGRGELGPIEERLERDLLRRAVVKTQEGTTFAILGIENQSTQDPVMPLRVMHYDAMTLHAACRRLAREARRGSRPPDSDFLSGLPHGLKLPPVITLVIYWAPDRWTAPTSLHELLDLRDPALRPIVPDYRINLLQPCELTPERRALFRTSVGSMLNYAKCMGNRAALERLLQEDDFFRRMDEPSANLALALNAGAALRNINLETYKTTEGYDMEDAWLDAMNYNRAQGLEQGREQGLEQGREETLRRTVEAMLEMGVSRDLVANMLTTKFNMTDLQVREHLARA